MMDPGSEISTVGLRNIHVEFTMDMTPAGVRWAWSVREAYYSALWSEALREGRHLRKQEVAKVMSPESLRVINTPRAVSPERERGIPPGWSTARFGVRRP